MSQREVLRTEIVVNRAIGFDGAGIHHNHERWRIEVVQTVKPWGEQFEVTARLLFETKGNGEKVPHNVQMGPEPFERLSVARQRAVSIANVVSGQLYPKFDRTDFDKRGRASSERAARFN